MLFVKEFQTSCLLLTLLPTLKHLHDFTDFLPCQQRWEVSLSTVSQIKTKPLKTYTLNNI